MVANYDLKPWISHLSITSFIDYYCRVSTTILVSVSKFRQVVYSIFHLVTTVAKSCNFLYSFHSCSLFLLG